MRLGDRRWIGTPASLGLAIDRFGHVHFILRGVSDGLGELEFLRFAVRFSGFRRRDQFSLDFREPENAVVRATAALFGQRIVRQSFQAQGGKSAGFEFDRDLVHVLFGIGALDQDGLVFENLEFHAIGHLGDDDVG